MENNCPTAEWRFWKDVSENAKKAVIDELLVKANSINRLKKKLLHRSESRRFSYRFEERHKFPEIDKKVYVRPEDEMTEQLHSTMVEKGQTVLEEVTSQLPLETSIEEVFPLEDAGFQIMTDRLDQTLGHRHRNVHWGLGKAHLRDLSALSSRQRIKQVKTLTSEVAGLKEHITAQQSQIVAQNNLINQIRRTLQISGIQFPDVELPPEMTSQPPTVAATSSQPPVAAATTSQPPYTATHHQPAIVTWQTSFFSFVLNCF
ncbi:hypothetical protein D8674_035505 [Pyrus ussuriensis x Pyrus communis]|uniref:Uncharacterized protein n=1 Tax=Pyrus ussuriensis x Pyrus communis TaxID=2448454 RepID=A0A5N5GCJ4_9ROSA|nr:hypothetical protein D8674_035505 [Pyrus ussuriensis x Pyrus communis]